MRETFRLGFQRFRLSRAGGGAGDLVHHVAEVVGLALHVVALRQQGRFPLLELPQARVRVARRGALDGGRGVEVENVALCVRLEQRLRLVLPVQVDQQRAELREGAHRARAAVHPGAGSPFPADLPFQYQSTVVRLHPQGGKGRQKAGEGGRGEFEGALDHGLLSTGTDDVARGALAQQQGQGVHQHRLARTGFAGEDVQARSKREGDVGDDGEVADPQLRQHYLRSRSERSPHCSFLRIRAKKPSGPSRTSSTGCSARLTTSRSPACMVVPTWPSKDTSTSSVHGGIGSTVTLAWDGTTSGRTASG